MMTHFGLFLQMIKLYYSIVTRLLKVNPDLNSRLIDHFSTSKLSEKKTGKSLVRADSQSQN